MDHEPFLRAIGAAPDDPVVRLVYADWLEEHGDLRGELVRLSVRLTELSSDDPDRSAIVLRVRELRPLCPAHWLARLDPPVWCAIGNIINARVQQPGEPQRFGTRQFRGGAKVFLASLHRTVTWGRAPTGAGPFPADPEHDYDWTIEVVGQHRVSRKWIGCLVAARLTENWRVKLVNHPGAKVRLAIAGWPGFGLAPAAFTAPSGAPGLGAVGALLAAIVAPPG